MTYTFRLPDLGEGVAEGEIAAWRVEVGQRVAEDDPLVEIQTDKTTVEIPSPVEGVVVELLAAAGDVLPTGAPLVVIGEDGATPPPSPPPAPAARVQAPPGVRRLAAELGVDLASLRGTGPDGSIRETDVRAAGGGGATGEGLVRRERLSGVRRVVAQHLERAHREVPAVTVVEECDWTDAEAARGERSLVALTLRALGLVLPRHPGLNATFEDGELATWGRYDVGVAVQTERGLVVPVVRGVDAAPVDALDAELRRLAEGARAGTLRPEELRGSTFSVTSAGRLAGLFATPLVNHPEVAILGVHRIDERPAVRDGAIVVRRLGLLSCSFDHRVVDGAQASAFLLDLISVVQAAERGLVS